ncbi:carboxymuconolactone decarboxylase family protein [Micromonospora aurantiaca (nom. illeg.)]|uniref:carboxymuconolactone decarboxylase family protein n=1 Tax=Micromonospora aurantiaca (nom. illeg.) TaxID=47850 RepID=UPI0033EB0CD3
MTGPRISPGSRRDVGSFGWLLSQAAGRVTGTGPPNLFLTLGRHRPLFRGWLRFARRLMPGGVLPRRETELVILRVAHLCACRYEFDHHLRLAQRAGVIDAEIERLTSDDVGGGWSTREQAVLAAADALVRDRDLDDERWAALRAHLDERECIELSMLAGHYVMLATTIMTLRIQPDS